MSAATPRARVRTCRAALVYDLPDDVDIDQLVRAVVGSDRTQVLASDGDAGAVGIDGPDLIILDLDTADLDGVGGGPALWRRYAHVPVIVVTRRRDATALIVGDVRIDRSARTVAVDGRPVELTRREFDLLAHLASHPGRVFSRGDLLREVWGSSAEWQAPATVTEHVRRVRLKIETDPTDPKLIHSVRGVGYRFGS